MDDAEKVNTDKVLLVRIYKSVFKRITVCLKERNIILSIYCESLRFEHLLF